MSRYIEMAHRFFSPCSAGPVHPAGAAGAGAIEIRIGPEDEAVEQPARHRLRGARTMVGAGSTAPGGAGGAPFGVLYNSREGRIANITEAVARHERGLAAANAGPPGGRALVALIGKRLFQARRELAALQAAPAVGG